MSDLHIEEDRLDRYALGRLPEEEAGRVEMHLLVCAVCQARLREADEFAAAFRAVATSPDARPARGWLPILRRRAAGLLAAGAVAAGVFFVAVQRERTPLAPAIVSLQALRGPESPAQVGAGKPAVLVFDIAREPRRAYEARIVDLAGAEVGYGKPSWKEGRLSLSLAGLRQGQYWVRLYREGSREPLVEYGLEAR